MFKTRHLAWEGSFPFVAIGGQGGKQSLISIKKTIFRF
jgi:hypothetical protein